MIEDVEVIEHFKGCIAYDCGAVFYIRLQKWATLSDHIHNHQETVFLMEGEGEMILWDKKQIVNAPVKLTIPSNTYHKFTALTDLIGLEIK
jgi:quercetin dioxygenase-like cupin family protein